MNIKRYDFDRAHCTGSSEFGCPSSMEESSIGDYVRWEDLISVGCLVPVPDGEAMGVWDAGFLQYFQCEHPGVWRLCQCTQDRTAPCDIKNISDGAVVDLTDNAPVQPVILKRLEDVG